MGAYTADALSIAPSPRPMMAPSACGSAVRLFGVGGRRRRSRGRGWGFTETARSRTRTRTRTHPPTHPPPTHPHTHPHTQPPHAPPHPSRPRCPARGTSSGICRLRRGGAGQMQARRRPYICGVACAGKVTDSRGHRKRPRRRRPRAPALPAPPPAWAPPGKEKEKPLLPAWAPSPRAVGLFFAARRCCRRVRWAAKPGGDARRRGAQVCTRSQKSRCARPSPRIQSPLSASLLFARQIPSGRIGNQARESTQ